MRATVVWNSCPELDVTEDDKAFQVAIELPGIDEKDVDVALSDRIFTIKGEKKKGSRKPQKKGQPKKRTMTAAGDPMKSSAGA